MGEYDRLKQRLARGWNTWNTRSVLSHVLLPYGFALNLGLKDYGSGAYLKEALVGRLGKEVEQIHPGPHAYDGSYTELKLRWKSVAAVVQSAVEGGDLILLVTPLARQRRPAALIAEAGLLWGRPGCAAQEGDALVGHLPDRTLYVYATKESVPDPYVAAQTPYLTLPLDSPVGISTGKKRTIQEIEEILGRSKVEHMARMERFGELADVYAVIQTCLAWDTIYEPAFDRVVTPVSRLWNVHWGGYVLFCWDTYFAAYMAALDHRDLAYANAIEITREKTERGFVPNFGTVNDVKSRDRSQPPVGSLVVRELYRRFGDRWLLEEVFDDLLEWNRWWIRHREHDGLLCWGTDPYAPLVDAYYEVNDVGNWQGAAYESGLDNSPMYDGVPFDPDAHLMRLADVGLNSLYVMDCDALADIARVLGRMSEARELQQRAEAFRRNLASLWDEESGIFLNRRTDTGEFVRRLSPTNFYPLLADAATPEQAERMIREHFYNPAEFWGDWILPSIARNDPAYPEQDYWRGRIWAPMNLLVYLGLRRYDLPQARADLAHKSQALLLKEWLAQGHVHENYNADSGEGCDKPNSDRFYHWGGLLGLIAFIEKGVLPGPEGSLAM